ncbi:nucleotidyltransferase family protein [Bacillus timonensis]|uniref:Nucleotidyltransferase family protein n=1 Tax=Bacillus timonensis TaxID=1033734 RepID=A0A4S3PTF7_9BACI|nr:nucleotidyltransferase family protein [Bacillus timonensis]
MLRNEDDVIKIISEDDRMMEILRAAKSLQLPDWWICAGFVRSKIWDTLHGFTERTNTPDVDVIYFDKEKIEESTEKFFEAALRSLIPDIPWSVKNEARMHVVNNILPYTSAVDAISKFPETATALGVKIDDKENVILTAPCGIEDVINMVLKPTRFFAETKERIVIFEKRIGKKNWKSIWPMIRVYRG